LIVAAGIATNFSDRRIPQKGVPPKKIKWGNILIFFTVFGSRVIYQKRPATTTGNTAKPLIFLRTPTVSAAWFLAAAMY
jgi:chromate transporter